MADDELLSAQQAGRILQVGEETVRRWADEKLIAHIVLPSGQRRFRRSDVEAILAPVKPEPTEAA